MEEASLYSQFINKAFALKINKKNKAWKAYLYLLREVKLIFELLFFDFIIVLSIHQRSFSNFCLLFE